MKQKRKNLQSSWWNRIIWGKTPSLETTRKEVDAADLQKHDDSYYKLKVVAPILAVLNKREFTQSDFNRFAVINYRLLKKHGEYFYYSQIWNLVDSGINLMDSLSVIAKIEANYQGEKEQKFYQQITEILETTCDFDIFYNAVLQKFNKLYRHLEDNNVKQVFNNYQQECQKIAQYGQWGLKVLLLHKQSNFIYIKTFENLNILIDFLTQDNEKNNHKYSLLDAINNNYDIFSELNSFLKVKETYQDYPHYILMLQYLVLSHKYAGNYQEFKRFLQLLQDWSQHYKIILDIRNKYPIAEYKQPANFLQEIKGEEIYIKYKSYCQKWY